jgi:hypothetical protein
MTFCWLETAAQFVTKITYISDDACKQNLGRSSTMSGRSVRNGCCRSTRKMWFYIVRALASILVCMDFLVDDTVSLTEFIELAISLVLPCRRSTLSRFFQCTVFDRSNFLFSTRIWISSPVTSGTCHLPLDPIPVTSNVWDFVSEVVMDLRNQSYFLRVLEMTFDGSFCVFLHCPTLLVLLFLSCTSSSNILSSKVCKLIPRSIN